jgi:FecR protein
MRSVVAFRRILSMALVLGASSAAFAADGGVWSVSKSSGEVWVTTTGAQPASLTPEEVLKPGDMIRTGRNGRVLLVRGEETMMIAPNSVIGLPTEAKDGMSTTILQQAGSILLEVEKKNVKHFEVETPYLAAVVKGTQFSVTVNAGSTSVEVRRGQVEVSDFKSGQIAQVLPGQTATSFEHGKGGLSLTGSGTVNPIEQGKPRASSIDRVPVPKGGLPAPKGGPSGTVIHALGHIGSSFASANAPSGQQTVKPNVIRISSTLGEVKLNVEKATHGLARGSALPGSTRGSKDNNITVWSNGGSGASGTSTASAGNSNSGSGGGGASSSGGGSAASSVASTAGSAVGSVVASADSAVSGLVNGATGNGKGNNGNGNGGVGNGNGKGNAKH